jgi:hypothetical protein
MRGDGKSFREAHRVSSTPTSIVSLVSVLPVDRVLILGYSLNTIQMSGASFRRPALDCEPLATKNSTSERPYRGRAYAETKTSSDTKRDPGGVPSVVPVVL